MTHCRIVDGRKSESADIEDPMGVALWSKSKRFKASEFGS